MIASHDLLCTQPPHKYGASIVSGGVHCDAPLGIRCRVVEESTPYVDSLHCAFFFCRQCCCTENMSTLIQWLLATMRNSSLPITHYKSHHLLYFLMVLLKSCLLNFENTAL